MVKFNGPNTKRSFLSEHKLRLVNVILIALLVIGICIPFYNWTDELNAYGKTLFTEVFKVLFQFLAIAFLGGILLQKYNASVQKDGERKAFRKNIHKALSDTYIDLKKLRWNLRFLCHTKEISIKDYREHILKLSEIKTRLEMIDYEVKANEKAVKFFIIDLQDKLENMEGYLRKILSEFCSLEPDVFETATIKLEKINRLNLFMKPGNSEGKSDFTINFRPFYWAALDALIMDEQKASES